MRRLIVLCSALAMLDLLLFTILAPMLPTYVDELHLTKVQAGILAGAFAWGSLALALPAGFMAQRFGPRKVVNWGLVVMSAASLGLGWTTELAVLDVARFIQGAAGAAVWSGGLAWLMAETPPERRGAVIGGAAVGAGGLGSLLGPTIGALGASVGTGRVFASLLVLTVPLFYLAVRTPDAPRSTRQPTAGTLSSIRQSRAILNSAVLLALPALALGFMTVLVPLKVYSLGGGASVIAGAFICSGILETVLGPFSGHWSDRSGRRFPYIFGLAVFCIGLAGLAAAQSLVLMLASYLVVAMGGGLFISPAFAILSDAAADSGLSEALGVALSGTSFSFGLAAGSLSGGLVAGAVGLSGPFFVLVAFVLLVAVYAAQATTLARSRGPTPQT